MRRIVSESWKRNVERENKTTRIEIDKKQVEYHNNRMSNIDFTEDNNPDYLLFLDGQDAIPAYVKESDMLSKAACADLSERAFADPAHRLYPCHTKTACWMSAAHFAGRHGTDETVKANIVKQAKFHGAEEDVQKVFDLLEPKIEKKAAAEEPMVKFALSIDWEGMNGRGKEDYYPVSNAVDVMMSSEAVADDYKAGRLPLPYMRKAARAIVKAATELTGSTGTLSPVVVKYGSVRLPDPYAASVILSGSRKAAGANVDDYMAVLDALKEGLAKCASFEAALEAADEAARQLFILDKKAGIEYGAHYQDPFVILFSGPTMRDVEKTAAAHVRIMDVCVPVVDFVNLSDAKIDQTFRKEAAAVIKQAKETVKGTPSSEKTASASEGIAALNADVQKVLLRTLAETCF